MTYFATKTPRSPISAATIYDASIRLVRRARAQKTSAASKLGRMIRLLGFRYEDRAAVWKIAQNAYDSVLRVDR
jgi:hypothetical protein